MKKITRIKCPNCGTKFEIEIKYDENFDSSTVCPDCAWQTSLWGFDLDKELIELEIEDYEQSTDRYFEL